MDILEAAAIIEEPFVVTQATGTLNLGGIPKCLPLCRLE